jgi:hypothetical protein
MTRANQKLPAPRVWTMLGANRSLDKLCEALCKSIKCMISPVHCYLLSGFGPCFVKSSHTQCTNELKQSDNLYSLHTPTND